MSKPAMRVRVWSSMSLTVLLAVMLPAAVLAQDDTKRDAGEATSGMPPEVAAAQTFLFAAYPDLIERPLAITLHTTDDGVAVSVVEDVGPAGADEPRPPLLTASFVFDAGAQLRRFDAHGPLVNEEQTLALQDELVVNPRWIDSDADVALTRQGARSTFGTAFEPLHAGAARALEEQLGASRTAAPARFRWYQDGTDAQPIFRNRPAWVTEATRSGPDDAPVTYRFEYEPFGGRLIAVVREGGR